MQILEDLLDKFTIKLGQSLSSGSISYSQSCSKDVRSMWSSIDELLFRLRVNLVTDVSLEDEVSD